MKATKTLLQKYNWYYPPVIGAALVEILFRAILMILLFPVALVISIVEYYQRVQKKFK